MVEKMWISFQKRCLRRLLLLVAIFCLSRFRSVGAFLPSAGLIHQRNFINSNSIDIVKGTTTRLDYSFGSNDNTVNFGPTYVNKGEPRLDTEGSVLGLTENKALTYHATGSKCLDFFFDVTPGIGEARLIKLMASAWDDDPSTTLKIIFQLGDPRRGKGDRKNFYKCLFWLYANHFETLMLNVHHVREHSCYKTLSDLLVLVARGPDALDDKRNVNQRPMYYDLRQRELHKYNVDLFFATLQDDEFVEWNPRNVYDEDERRWNSPELRDRFVEFMWSQNKEQQ